MEDFNLLSKFSISNTQCTIVFLALQPEIAMRMYAFLLKKLKKSMQSKLKGCLFWFATFNFAKLSKFLFGFQLQKTSSFVFLFHQHNMSNFLFVPTIWKIVSNFVLKSVLVFFFFSFSTQI